MVDTYDNLKAELVGTLARSDVNSDSSVVDTAIDLAESYINKKLRILEMEKQATLTVSAQDVDLPDDYVDLRNLEYTSKPKDIQYVPLTLLKQIYAGEGTGRPKVFTHYNDSTTNTKQLRFAPTPNGSYEMELTYYGKVPALNSSNTSNWLLTEEPEIYLNGGLYYLFRRYRNKLAADYFPLFRDRIKELNDREGDRAFGPSGTRMRPQGAIV